MLTIFHLTILFLPSVMLFGVELKCPAFTEGVKEIVCKINKTAISQSKCKHVQDLVTFEHIDKNKKQSTVCQTDVCDPAKIPSPGKCCCDDSDPEIKTCKYSHVADRSYDEGTRLECMYCTEQANYVDVKDESCSNISFDPLSSEGRMIGVTPTWLIGVIFYIICELAVV